MAKFELAAFADEYSPVFDEQIEGLLANGIRNLEIRGVDGHSIDAVTPDEAKDLKKKLDANGLRVSCVGSPLGKIDLKDDMDAHIETEKRIIELAHIFGCDRIRMFSLTSRRSSMAAPIYPARVAASSFSSSALLIMSMMSMSAFSISAHFPLLIFVGRFCVDFSNCSKSSLVLL